MAQIDAFDSGPAVTPGDRRRGGPLDRLRAIASTINAGGGLPTLLRGVLVAVCDGKPWEQGCILAANRARGFSELVMSFGQDDHPDPAVRWNLATSPVLDAVNHRRPVVLDDAQDATRYPTYSQDARVLGYRTSVLMPLDCTNADDHEMVLSIHTNERTDVGAEEIDFLTTVAHLVSIAVEKAKHLQREQAQTQKLRHMLESGTALMELILDGAAPSVAASMVGALLPNPVVILDFVTGTTTVRRSPAPDLLAEDEWRALAEQDAAPVLATLVENAGRAGATPQRLNLSGIGSAIDVPVEVEPFRVDGDLVGGLMVFPQGRVLDAFDRVIIQQVRLALAAQVMRHHVEVRADAQNLSHFFGALCRADASEMPAFSAKAARMGIDLSRPTCVVAVRFEGDGQPSTGVLRQVLTRILGRTVPENMVVEHETSVMLGWPVGAGTAPASEVLERLVLQPLRARWTAKLTVVVGPICRKPLDYGPAVAECSRTLKLAQMFKRDGVVRQEDFGPFAMMLSAMDGALLHHFVDASLGPLRRHDAETGGALCETAQTFIDEACRLQATASRLGIHVTTLRYRMRRLHEMFGLDLDDAETRFRLSLALRLGDLTTSDRRES